MTLRVVSYGGGVQSTALLVLAAQERIDWRTFLFCNVGDDSEYPPTLAYLQDVALPFAAEHGIDLQVLQRFVLRGERKGEVDTLLGRLTREGTRSVPIPVRRADTGAPGNRSCTEDYKIKVVGRWVRARGASPESPARVALGISTDEIGRAHPGVDPRLPWQHREYPLLDLGLSRVDCHSLIERAGLPVPPKSACWFCPFTKPSTFQRRRHEEPVLFRKAVDLERSLNGTRDRLGKDHVYLTRFGKPLDEVTSDDEQLGFEFDGGDCDSGYCMT